MPSANRAALAGPSKFNWWKDWRGECAAIIASGPSTNKDDVALLRNRIHVVAIKHNVDLCPWADVVYGCDEPWWKSRNGLPEFSGLKLAYAEKACARYRDIKRISISDKYHDRILVDDPAVIGSGGNSGFQVVNILVQFGVTGIILVGFDMNATHSKPYWFGRKNGMGMSNAGERNYKRWRPAFENNAGLLAQFGVDVVNASTMSALTCFRRATICDALRGWGL